MSKEEKELATKMRKRHKNKSENRATNQTNYYLLSEKRLNLLF